MTNIIHSKNLRVNCAHLKLEDQLRTQSKLEGSTIENFGEKMEIKLF